MSEGVLGRIRRRRRGRSGKKVRLVLLALGLCALAIGAVLCLSALPRGNTKIAALGLIYFLAGLALLGIRGIAVYLRETRERTPAGAEP
jgi:membrane protein implicated in regulation of membrane protease activity